jgi:thiamine biosynthesis protein ThiS
MSDVVERLTISLNGDERRVAAGLTVAGLIGELGLDTRKVAVERNREIVPRSTYAAVALAAGDELEIVHFIGGG